MLGMKRLLVGAIATLLGASGAIAQTFNPGPPLVSSGTISSATVVSIGDGDTLRVNNQGQVLTIRLACVDCAGNSATSLGPAVYRLA